MSLEAGEVYKTRAQWHVSKLSRLFTLFEELQEDATRVTSVLDLGCRTGTTTKQILEFFPNVKRVLAVDGSKSMIEKAQETNPDPRIEYKKVKTQTIEELETETFDVVVSNFALHWVKNKEKIFDDIKRLTKKGAYLLIGTCADLPDFHKALDRELRTHFSIAETQPFYYFDQPQWTEFLNEHGWTIKAINNQFDPHPVDRKDFLTEWWGASKGRAFYGHDLSELDQGFQKSLIEKLDKQYFNGGEWLFIEETITMVAQKQ